jgi:Domain of unknown function (DUF5606)
MELSEIVSITGMPGLYKVATRRADGLIVTSFTDNVTKFVSGRVHMFSTLDNITIFTQEGNRELKLVLAEMKSKEAKHSPAALKNDEEIKAYFATVVPDYDTEKVYVSHMKKLISWYNTLNGKKLIEELTQDKTATTAADTDAQEVATTDKPKKAAAKPKKETAAVKPKVEKVTKTATKAPAVGRKTVTPRKAS